MSVPIDKLDAEHRAFNEQQYRSGLRKRLIGYALVIGACSLFGPTGFLAGAGLSGLYEFHEYRNLRELNRIKITETQNR